MPDGDKVHVKLAHRYQKVYKQLCEGQYDDAELAHEVLGSLKRDLQGYGDEPLQLTQHYNGADQTAVDTRLKGMRSYVEQGINSFVAQMIRHGSVAALRRLPMTRPSIGIDDDLFDLGR